MTRILLKPMATLILVMAAGSVLAQPAAQTPALLAAQNRLEKEVVKLLLANQLAEATDTCVTRLMADPADAESPQALQTVLDYCVMMKQTGLLEASFRQWVTSQPKSAVAHAWLAAALIPLADKRDEAEQELLQALKLDPKCAEVRFRLAGLRELQGKDEDAQAGWRKFLELEPDTDRAWLVKHRLVVVETAPLVKGGGGIGPDFPSWSPDGKQVVYGAGWDGRVAVCNVESGQERVLGQVAPKLNQFIEWSPDGRSILATGCSENYSTRQLFLMDAVAGGQPKMLFDKSIAWQGRWSPDGKTIVFWWQGNGSCLMNADGTGAAPMAVAQALDRGLEQPNFSPDGSWMCSTAYGGDRGVIEVFLWNTHDGSNCVQLTKNGQRNISPAVRSDGHVVVFASGLAGQRRSLRAVAIAEPERDVAVYNAFYDHAYGPWFSLSPDGRRLVCGRTAGKSYPLWTAAFGGLNMDPVKLSAVPKAGGMTVSVTSRSADPQQFDMTYRLFDANSVMVSEGPVGKPKTILQPKEVIEFPLPLPAAKQAGTYTVKLTAATEKGERVVELVDYEVK